MKIIIENVAPETPARNVIVDGIAYPVTSFETGPDRMYMTYEVDPERAFPKTQDEIAEETRAYLERLGPGRTC
jgi:hypothetical protein